MQRVLCQIRKNKQQYIRLRDYDMEITTLIPIFAFMITIIGAFITIYIFIAKRDAKIIEHEVKLTLHEQSIKELSTQSEKRIQEWKNVFDEKFEDLKFTMNKALDEIKRSIERNSHDR